MHRHWGCPFRAASPTTMLSTHQAVTARPFPPISEARTSVRPQQAPVRCVHSLGERKVRQQARCRGGWGHAGPRHSRPVGSWQLCPWPLGDSQSPRPPERLRQTPGSVSALKSPGPFLFLWNGYLYIWGIMINKSPNTLLPHNMRDFTHGLGSHSCTFLRG